MFAGRIPLITIGQVVIILWTLSRVSSLQYSRLSGVIVSDGSIRLGCSHFIAIRLAAEQDPIVTSIFSVDLMHQDRGNPGGSAW